MFEALANDEQLALEGAVVLVALMPRAASDEHLPEHGSGLERLASKAAKVRGYIAPSEEHLPFFADDLLEQPLDSPAPVGVVRQEDHAGCVVPFRRQREAQARRFPAQEAVRHLHQDAGTIAGVGFVPARATVFEIDEDLQRLRDNPM